MCLLASSSLFSFNLYLNCTHSTQFCSFFCLFWLGSLSNSLCVWCFLLDLKSNEERKRRKNNKTFVHAYTRTCRPNGQMHTHTNAYAGNGTHVHLYCDCLVKWTDFPKWNVIHLFLNKKWSVIRKLDRIWFTSVGNTNTLGHTHNRAYSFAVDLL